MRKYILTMGYSVYFSLLLMHTGYFGSYSLKKKSNSLDFCLSYLFGVMSLVFFLPFHQYLLLLFQNLPKCYQQKFLTFTSAYNGLNGRQFLSLNTKKKNNFTKLEEILI